MKNSALVVIDLQNNNLSAGTRTFKPGKQEDAEENK